MTDEFLDLMEEQTQYKLKYLNKYKEIQGNIRNKIRETQEKCLSEKCNEIEDLDKKYDRFNEHKRSKSSLEIRIEHSQTF